LPPGYGADPEKRYPVIYFYHGWSQRYFGSTSRNGFDKGDDNNGDNIANYVATHDVIVVKPDGYNRNHSDQYYLRPYNVSPVETYRQYPIYFPELVTHIDANYNTIADRDHRAISGLSMGGFMTFWISGKYPHMVTAAGNFCGSTEFWVGPKDTPVEYRHLDMHKNYQGLNVRLNYGDKDFIRGYHQDMNKVWTQVMDNYEYHIYDAAHSTCGMSEMFDFLMESFENPPGKPQTWHHTDVYPDFSVWDYHVNTDRSVPGFTVLENVTKRGFRCSVREFLPDGELLPFVNVTVTTAPLYEKNQPYQIHDTDLRSGHSSIKTILSDHSGRLKIALNGSQHEIGINEPESAPNICIASFKIEDACWATPGKEVAVSIELLNKGGTEAEGVKARLEATRNGTTIIQDELKYGNIGINETTSSRTSFSFQVQKELIEIVKFKLLITDKNGHEWSDFIEIPVMPEQPEITDFEIADGKFFEVVEAGDDTVTAYLGIGNGDGIANPGESIVVLIKDQDLYRRAFLYTSDEYVNPSGLNIRISDNWGSYDHVGGSAKYSVPVISSDCPEDYHMDFFAEYWLPDYPYHIIKRGKITLSVTGKDHTAPKVLWVQVDGDNLVQARIYDGGKIQSAKATLRSIDDPKKFLQVELKDDGTEGDRTEEDLVFSKKIPEQRFGLHHIEIESEDSFGNRAVKEYPDVFVLH